MTVEIEVYRPPARLGPRIPFWAILAMIWGGTFAIILTVDILSSQSPDSSFDLLLGTIGLVASLVMAYARLRLVRGTSVWSNGLLTRGYPIGDTSDEVRLSDPEERAARRRLRRGAITRREYERIIARRHFVHGEYSAAEYHEALRQIGDDTPPGSVGSPPARTQG